MDSIEGVSTDFGLPKVGASQTGWHLCSVELMGTWVWLKIEQEGQTAGFGPCVHLPGLHFGTGFLSHSHITILSILHLSPIESCHLKGDEANHDTGTLKKSAETPM